MPAGAMAAEATPAGLATELSLAGLSTTVSLRKGEEGVFIIKRCGVVGWLQTARTAVSADAFVSVD